MKKLEYDPECVNARLKFFYNNQASNKQDKWKDKQVENRDREPKRNYAHKKYPNHKNNYQH